ncbi:MAG: hypothetical protein GYA14_10735 [Ignavibacteria bacterium]|nr:hypothetical protein [Ignavibacteria bacterium]
MIRNKTILKKIFFILIPVSITIIFIPGFTNSPVADDWIVIQRNMNLTFPDILKLFTSTNFGWYRPIFELFIYLCSLCFNFQAIDYHVVILILYLFVLFLVGKISFLLTEESGIGFLSAFIFGILSIHSEPVLWISAANEILTAIFLLSSIYFYLVLRINSKKNFTYLFSLLFMVAALSTKETSAFFPLMIPLIEYFIINEKNKNFTLHKLIPVIPFLLIQIIYLVIRITAGFPYEISFHSLKVVYVLLYYLLVIVFSLPDNYGYLSSVNLWLTEPLFPIIIILLSIVALSGYIWLFIKYSFKKHFTNHNNFIKLSICWMLLSVLPILSMVSGRTAFLASIGYSWIFSLFIFSIIKSIRNHSKKIKLVFATISAGLILINISVVQYRCHYWRLAGWTVKNVIHQLNDIVINIPRGEEIYIFGLPDHLNRAYTFRNAVSTINKIYYPDHKIKVWLDTELNKISKKNYLNKNSFIYQNGNLIKQE